VTATRATQLQLPSLRGALIRIHRDLFGIDRFVPFYISSEPLRLVEKLILVLEDRRFFSHWGIDWKSCMREVARAVSWQNHGGASTIDMQFVRTATGFREKTFKRKLYEMTLAFLIQHRYSNIEIFRAYLDCAFFGSHLYGIEAACKEYFDKSSEDLILDEAAQIAAMLVYPKPLAETEPWRVHIRRRADYAKRFFPRFEQRFNELPSREDF
jgi:membrane peptidoglycan carboxypeptidase